MSRLATSFVLGYHGCSKEVADKVLSRSASLVLSDTKYDWVGRGVYFWEADPQRAWEWAAERCEETGQSPAVVGAIIDLRNCLDLLNRTDQDLVKDAYQSLAETYQEAGEAMPQNRNAPGGGDKDRRARSLDCEVINRLHLLMDEQSDPGADEEGQAAQFFDTVRGMFTEGDQLYPGAAFYHQSHVQIAVRNLECIKGLFYPPEIYGLPPEE